MCYSPKLQQSCARCEFIYKFGQIPTALLQVCLTIFCWRRGWSSRTIWCFLIAVFLLLPLIDIYPKKYPTGCLKRGCWLRTVRSSGQVCFWLCLALNINWLRSGCFLPYKHTRDDRLSSLISPYRKDPKSINGLRNNNNKNGFTHASSCLGTWWDIIVSGNLYSDCYYRHSIDPTELNRPESQWCCLLVRVNISRLSLLPNHPQIQQTVQRKAVSTVSIFENPNFIGFPCKKLPHRFYKSIIISFGWYFRSHLQMHDSLI